jgi:S1-C subfamily serine protease
LSATDRVQLISLLRKWLTSLESAAANGPHAFVGLVLLDFRASVMKRRAVGLPDVPGLLVHAVEAASQAEAAGFRKGDLICSVQGEPIASLAELRRAFNKEKPRTKQLVVMRGSDSVRLDLLVPR